MVRVLPVVLGLLLLAPAPARAAATLTLGLDSSAVQWGDRAGLGGELRADGAARAGVPVVVETASLPGRHAFARAPAVVRTAADGSYGFSVRPDRGLRIRARADRMRLLSPVRELYVIPRAELTDTRPRSGVTRISVTFHVPRATGLSGRALFYLSSLRASRLPFVGSAPVRPVRAGVFRATRSFRLDPAWHGSFRYGHCYDAPRASGLDDPRRACRRGTLSPPRAKRAAYRAEERASSAESAALAAPFGPLASP